MLHRESAVVARLESKPSRRPPQQNNRTNYNAVNNRWPSPTTQTACRSVETTGFRRLPTAPTACGCLLLAPQPTSSMSLLLFSLLVLLLCTTTTVSIPPTSDPSSHHSADATRPQGSSLSVPFAPTPCPPGTYTEHDDVPRGGGSGGVINPNVCRACPAGRYGADYDMQDARCSGACDRGHWCPQGSTSARARPCPAGRFGSTLGSTTSSCTGVCKEGYYCPERSVSDAHQRCGAVHLYCPRGSAVPVQVSPGHYTTGGNSATQDLDDGKASGPNHHGDNDEYTRTGQRLCEPGHYCGAVNSLNAYPGGVRRDCPRGTYGSQYGLESVGCSGSCPKGHYCPTRTIKPTNCPAGTYGTVADAGRTRNVTWTGDPVIELASPLNVVAITVGLDEARCSGWCALGHYCPPASVVATQIQCPAGRYGNVTGLRTSECSPHCSGQNDAGEAVGNVHGAAAFPLSYKCPAGDASLCEPGYYCPMGSTSSRMVPCGGSTLYCPRASSVPTPVSVGYYTVPLGPNRATNRSSQLECPRGSYCIGGIRTFCPAGTYGATTGLSTPDCSGPCTPGHWCKEGAWDRQEK